MPDLELDTALRLESNPLVTTEFGDVTEARKDEFFRWADVTLLPY
jgi:hypothetical protein